MREKERVRNRESVVRESLSHDQVRGTEVTWYPQHGTYARDRVKWKRWRSPLKVRKD